MGAVLGLGEAAAPSLSQISARLLTLSYRRKKGFLMHYHGKAARPCPGPLFVPVKCCSLRFACCVE